VLKSVTQQLRSGSSFYSLSSRPSYLLEKPTNKHRFTKEWQREQQHQSKYAKYTRATKGHNNNLPLTKLRSRTKSKDSSSILVIETKTDRGKAGTTEGKSVATNTEELRPRRSLVRLV
jgi:hypothetical protein